MRRARYSRAAGEELVVVAEARKSTGGRLA